MVLFYGEPNVVDCDLMLAPVVLDHLVYKLVRGLGSLGKHFEIAVGLEAVAADFEGIQVAAVPN